MWERWAAPGLLPWGGGQLNVSQFPLLQASLATAFILDGPVLQEPFSLQGLRRISERVVCHGFDDTYGGLSTWLHKKEAPADEDQTPGLCPRLGAAKPPH